MKSIFYLLMFLTLTSCRYFNISPVNGITTKNLNQKPSSKDMVGLWEVDSYSYDLIRKRGYRNQKVVLEIKNDGTFEAKNLPDFINVSQKSYQKRIHTTGSWEIGKDFKGKKWVLYMSFKKSELYKNGMSTSYDLYIQNDKLVIWYFIGDPDTGERFLFTKKQYQNDVMSN
ncbi:hypothetical protein [uncultured Aquimarina sp.]|uniref:hypothetical protein n=1 Tax=uncultured Aquimarina sp. TaxID=575652 RepID=UPI002616B958|nr:hypothetical protein [uncultured Aquimarina sp.]